ncbi:hypothetical protein RF55_14625 [Lasius niger]|uniref:Uncharacterized protein n=1 Tax=Lasius niger TaxID=67767 RepID=A0A0J7K853_LASNI|nr:hypothetical protein RF55_14625 [Lasius niger]
MEWIVEEVFGKKGRVKGVEERTGEGGKIVLLVELEEKWDKEELWEKRGEIWKRWGIRIDENLTMEERRYRWKIREKARLERWMGRRVETTNREIWIEDKEWYWAEEEKRWREKGRI